MANLSTGEDEKLILDGRVGLRHSGEGPGGHACEPLLEGK